MRNEKQHMTKRIELPNQEKSECSKKRKPTHTLKYVKQTPSNKWWKKEFKKYSISGERVDYSKSYNIAELLSKGKRFDCPFVKYSGSFLKWTKKELKQIDQKIRKIMMMHEVIYPKDDVDRLYESRKERGWGHASIDDSVDTKIKSAEEDWLQRPATIQTTLASTERK